MFFLCWILLGVMLMGGTMFSYFHNEPTLTTHLFFALGLIELTIGMAIFELKVFIEQFQEWLDQRLPPAPPLAPPDEPGQEKK